MVGSLLEFLFEVSLGLLGGESVLPSRILKSCSGQSAISVDSLIGGNVVNVGQLLEQVDSSLCCAGDKHSLRCV